MERQKGGMILMSSSGGVVGTPFIQVYSATKAYGFTLAEALWGELSEYGIDVMAVLPGNTIGQSFSDVPAGTPGFQTGAEVVQEAFEVFGTVPAMLAWDTSRETLSSMFPVEARMGYILKMKELISAVRDEHGSGSDAKP